MFKMKIYSSLKGCFKIIGFGKVFCYKVYKNYLFFYKFKCVKCVLNGNLVMVVGDVRCLK